MNISNSERGEKWENAVRKQREKRGILADWKGPGNIKVSNLLPSIITSGMEKEDIFFTFIFSHFESGL